MSRRGDAIPTYAVTEGFFEGQVVIRRVDKAWVLRDFNLVRTCFPHLEYIDLDDLEFRIHGRHGVLVAEVNGKVVGFSIWYETLDGIAYIWLTGVLPGYRGRGIGTALLRAVLDDIRRNGMRYIWCKISKEKRGWVRKHLAMGFRVIEHVREDGRDVYKLGRASLHESLPLEVIVC